ncbi:hypothetical protein DAPPUDRAFT_252099 [Daphnia pulex]|uniref:Uncharacterized protein n=1 Tax=Daphnia pulex TaxID=6669 RepID=E9H1Y7_DAPPU|nr:hypothetical protein DAPPUDRAFT_252099 [Daphnia pulex]|eukprot:EFX74285.1 hypothetical protein DAPPUDRAFT_252099 [Daphnia pulex]
MYRSSAIGSNVAVEACVCCTLCLPSKHRYGKRMAPALSKANWSVQNPTEEWTGSYGDAVATSGKGGNVMDFYLL